MSVKQSTSSYEKKFTELLARVEQAEAQNGRLKVLEEKVLAFQKKESPPASHNISTTNGLSVKEKNSLRNEVLNIKKLILKERKKIAESKPVAAANVGGISVEEFKKFQSDVLEKTTSFRASVKDLKNENHRLKYQSSHMGRSLIELEKKTCVPKPFPVEKKVRAIIYDCDGTLVDSEPQWRIAQIEVFGTVGITLTNEDCSQTTGLHIRDIVEMRFNEKPWDAYAISKYVIQKSIETKVAELIRTKSSLKPGVVESINYFNPTVKYVTFEDLREKEFYTVTKNLAMLRKEWDEAELGIIEDEDLKKYLGMVVKCVELEEDDETAKCCLDNHMDEQWLPACVLSVSSADEMKFAVCSSSAPLIIDAALSLLPSELRILFSVIQSASELEYAKPHPQAYMTTARKLKVNPKDCIAIEDSFPGVISALSSGMKVIAVPEKESTKFQCAEVMLSSLEQVSAETCGHLFPSNINKKIEDAINNF